MPPQLSGSDLHRSDTRSFGESHASELSSDVTSPGIPSTPPQSGKPLSDTPAEHVPSMQGPSTPINPADLNQSPAVIPGDGTHQSLPDAASPLNSGSLPTVAETGVPVAAGASGPGPASGSLLDLKHNVAPGNVPAPESQAPPRFESAAEEKKRLEAAYSEAPVSGKQPQANSSADAQHESAEDEKKRLEREEREKLLRKPTGNDGASGKEPDEDLPPYQDM